MHRLPLLPALLALAACGSSDGGGDPSVAHLEVFLHPAGSGLGVAGARVLLLDPVTGAALTPARSTDFGGVARFDLEVPAVRVRAFAPGYESRPRGGEALAPVSVAAGRTRRMSLSLFPREGGGGIVEGTVIDPQQPTAGTLVIAGGAAGLSDIDGRFVIFDVPAGMQRVTALRQGFGAGSAMVDVPAGGRSSPVEIHLKPEATGGIAGTVGFAGKRHGRTEVIVTEATSGEVMPGLVTTTDGTFHFLEVPAGDYVATAGRGNDGMVPDPAKLEARMHVAVGGVGDAQLTLVDAMALLQPGGSATPAAPASIPELKIIQWELVVNADDYMLELLDESGRTIWGGLDPDTHGPRPFPGRVAGDHFIVPAEVAQPLQHQPYSLVVYALQNSAGEAGFRIMTRTEEQLGWIEVSPP